MNPLRILSWRSKFTTWQKSTRFI